MVGANDQGIDIARQWSQSPISGVQVIGFVDDFRPMGTSVVNHLKVIGRPTSLDELVRQTGANKVVVVPNAVAWETFHDKPLLEHTIVWLRQHSVKDIAINLHYCPEVILNRFGDGAALGVRIVYSREDTLLGTAGAVRKLNGFLEGGPPAV